MLGPVNVAYNGPMHRFHWIMIVILAVAGASAGVAFGINADTIILGEPLFKWPSKGRAFIRVVAAIFGLVGGAVGLPLLVTYVYRNLRDQH
jgi:hypothetical protein